MSRFVYRSAYITGFVYRISVFAIHKLFCGLQNIHKLFCDSYISFQCPQIQCLSLKTICVNPCPSVVKFETTDLVKRIGIHKSTAMGLLRQLKAAGILKDLRPGSGRRAAVIGFPKLLNLAEGRRIL